MINKSLIAGLLAVMVFSLVGGIFTANAVFYSNLTCTPSSQYAVPGQWVNFAAFYSGDANAPLNQLYWQANGGSPTNGYGGSFGTQFSYLGSGTVDSSRLVTVTDGYQTATCSVYLYGATVTPTPTVTPNYGSVSVTHTAQNITRGGQGSSVVAYNGDRLRFSTTLSVGPQYAQDVYLRDWLPGYLTYVTGSTISDNGIVYNDSLVRGPSLALGDLYPFTVRTIMFDAIVTAAPNGTLANTMNVHTRGFSDQTRATSVSVVGSSHTPTPTPTVTVTPVPHTRVLTVISRGRNVTVGQTTEHTAIAARGNDTLDIILHVAAGSTTALSNVFVTDILPSGVSYISGTTTLNGVATMDGVSTTGLNIGTIAAGQQVAVKFSVKIDATSVPAAGRVTVRTTAQVRADGVATVSSQLPITLGVFSALEAASGVQTGPADVLVIAMMIAAIMTIGYGMYTQTDVFGRRYTVSVIGKSDARGRTPNFLE